MDRRRQDEERGGRDTHMAERGHGEGGEGGDHPEGAPQEEEAGPQAVAAAERALAAFERDNGGAGANGEGGLSRSVESLVEEMIEQAYADEGMEVRMRTLCAHPAGPIGVLVLC